MRTDHAWTCFIWIYQTKNLQVSHSSFWRELIGESVVQTHTLWRTCKIILFRHILKLQSELLSQVCCCISLLSLGLSSLNYSSSKNKKNIMLVCFRVFLCTYCVVQRHTSSPHSSWPIIIIKLNCRRHCLHSFISRMTSCELLLRKAIYTTSIYM